MRGWWERWGCTSTTRYLRSLSNGSVDAAGVPTGADCEYGRGGDSGDRGGVGDRDVQVLLHI